MPEVRFRVRWPDGTVERCWSPSLVVTEHLREGATYGVADFAARSRAALLEGSERVRARWGSPCRTALDQLAAIERRAAGADADGLVVVEGFER